MKEEDVMPGTTYPILENVLFFLPKRLKKKLCCVTPLKETVSTIRMRDVWPFGHVESVFMTSGMKQIISNAGRMELD